MCLLSRALPGRSWCAELWLFSFRCLDEVVALQSENYIVLLHKSAIRKLANELFNPRKGCEGEEGRSPWWAGRARQPSAAEPLDPEATCERCSVSLSAWTAVGYVCPSQAHAQHLAEAVEGWNYQQWGSSACPHAAKLIPGELECKQSLCFGCVLLRWWLTHSYCHAAGAPCLFQTRCSSLGD